MTLQNDVRNLEAQVGLQASHITRLVERLEKVESRLEILEIAVETPRPAKTRAHDELEGKMMELLVKISPVKINAGAVASNLNLTTQQANDRLRSLASRNLICSESLDGRQISYFAKEA